LHQHYPKRLGSHQRSLIPIPAVKPSLDPCKQAVRPHSNNGRVRTPETSKKSGVRKTTVRHQLSNGLHNESITPNHAPQTFGYNYYASVIVRRPTARTTHKSPSARIVRPTGTPTDFKTQNNQKTHIQSAPPIRPSPVRQITSNLHKRQNTNRSQVPPSGSRRNQAAHAAAAHNIYYRMSRQEFLGGFNGNRATGLRARIGGWGHVGARGLRGWAEIGAVGGPSGGRRRLGLGNFGSDPGRRGGGVARDCLLGDVELTVVGCGCACYGAYG